MKYIITALLVVASTLSLSAQNLTVRMTPEAEAAVAQIDSIKLSSSVNGYRIGIFFDNGHQARSKATEARDRFTANFPTEPVYMVYQSPYYKVSAGNCLTEEEAIILFEKIRHVFPSAYVMRENMDITSFIERPVEMPIIDSTLIVSPTSEFEPAPAPESAPESAPAPEANPFSIN